MRRLIRLFMLLSVLTTVLPAADRLAPSPAEAAPAATTFTYDQLFRLEVIDTDPSHAVDIGVYPDIAIAPNNNANPFPNQPAISYRASNGDLKLAIRGALPSSDCGGPTPGWKCIITDGSYGAFSRSDIEFQGNASGNFGLAFISEDQDHLVYKTYNNGGQVLDTVALRSVPGGFSGHFKTATLFYTGDYPRVAAHEFVYDSDEEEGHSYLWYEEPNAACCALEDQVEEYVRDDSTPRVVGYYVSGGVVWDPGEGRYNPRLAYRAANGELRYAVRGGASNTTCPDDTHDSGYSPRWACFTLQTGSNVYFTSAYHNPNNGADSAIAYYEHNSQALMYAHYVASGGNCAGGGWQCDVIDTMNTGGADPQGLELQLAVFNGIAHIAYADRGAGGTTAIKMASYVGVGGNCGPTNGVLGKAWRCVMVDDGAGGTQVLEHASLALDATGRAYIAYHNASTQSLMLATEKLPSALTFSKTYSPAIVNPGGQTAATYYLHNGQGVAVTDLGFEDYLMFQTVRRGPAPLYVPMVNNTCGGSTAVTNADYRVELAGVTLAPGASCTVTVQVTANGAGNFDDDPSPLVSNEVRDTSANGGALTVLLGQLPGSGPYRLFLPFVGK